MDDGPSILHVRIARDADACTLTVAGEVDLSTSTQLKRALDDVFDVAPLPPLIRAELRGVRFLDTTGLGLLLSAHKRARGRDSRFVVSSTSPELDRLFEVTGVDAFLCG